MILWDYLTPQMLFSTPENFDESVEYSAENKVYFSEVCWKS